VPSGTPGGPRARLLREHAGVRELVVDEPSFNPGTAGYRSQCRLQLFTGSGLRPVAVAIQTVGDGASLTNAAEQYLAAVWHRFVPDDPLPPIWIQRQSFHGRDEGFCLVEFTVDDTGTPAEPRWRGPFTDEEMAQLVGRPVAGDRGPQTALQYAPEPQMFFTPAWVIRLPRPGPGADRGCRPAGISTTRLLANQAWPRRGPGPCSDRPRCWYHRGDWHVACRTAIRVASSAAAAGIPQEELPIRAAEDAEKLLAGWELEAAQSLLLDPIQPDERRFINGRHRTQAMLDAGVRRTLVARWRPPT
jgi:hypothetical protein